MLKKLALLFSKIFRKKSIWIFFAIFLFIFALFRHSFFGLIIDYTISKKYPELKISFSNLSFDHSSIIFDDFCLTTQDLEIETNQIQIGFQLDLYRFQIAPKIKILQPHVFTKRVNFENPPELKNGSKEVSKQILNFLNNRVFYQIEDGFWNHKDEQRFNFSLISNPDYPQLKKLSISLAESLSTDSKAEIDIKPYHQETCFQVKLFDFDIHWLSELDFTRKIIKVYELSNVQGKISGLANLRFDPQFRLLRSDLQLDIEHIKIETTQLESLEVNHLALKVLIPQTQSKDEQREELFDSSGSINIDQLVLKLDHYTTLSTSGKISFNLPLGSEVDCKGAITIGKDSAGFILQGQRKKTNFKSEDFIVDFLFIEEKLKNSKAHFTFSNIKDGIWVLKAKIDQIEANYLTALQKTLDYYFPSLNAFQLNKGSISLETKISFQDHIMRAIELDKIDLRNADIKVPELDLQVQLSKLEAGLDYDLKEKKLKKWFTNAYSLHLSYEDKKFGVVEIKDADLKIRQELDNFSFSTVKGKIFDEIFKIDFFGHQYHPDINLDIKLRSDFILSKLGIQGSPYDSHLYKIKAKIDHQDNFWGLNVSLSDGLATELKAHIKTEVYDLEKLFKKEGVELFLLGIHEGIITGKNLNKEIHSPIIQALHLPWDIDGEIQLSGIFKQGVLDLDLEFNELAFSTNEIYFKQDKRVPGQTATSGKLIFDCIHDKLNLSVPLEGGNCLHKESSLWFEDTYGHLQILDTHLTITDLNAKCENLLMHGMLELEFIKEKPFKLNIAVDSVKGKVVNLQRFARHFPEFKHLNIPFDGDLDAIEDGFNLQMILYPSPLLPDWTLTAHVHHGEFFDLNLMKIKDVSFDLKMDSQNPSLNINNLKSLIELNGVKLPYIICGESIEIGLQKDLSAKFSLSIESSFLKIMDLKGELKSSDHEFFLDVMPNQFIKDWVAFKKVDDQWIEGFGSVEIKGEYIVSLVKRLVYQAELKQVMQLLSLQDFEQIQSLVIVTSISDEHQLNFEMHTQSPHENELISLETHFQNKELEIKNCRIESISSCGKANINDQSIRFSNFVFENQQGKLWINQGNWDPIEERFDLKLEKIELSTIKNLLEIVPFMNQSLEGRLLACGNLIIEKDNSYLQVEKLSCEDGVFKDQLDIVKPFKIHFLNNHQLEISNLDLRLKENQDQEEYLCIQADSLTFDRLEKDFQTDKLLLTVSPELVKKIPTFLSPDLSLMIKDKIGEIKNWDNLVHLTVKLHLNPSETLIEGELKDGYYWIKDQSYFFDHVHFKLLDHIFSLKGNFKFLNYDFNFHTELDVKERASIVLNLENLGQEQEKLKAIFALKENEIDLISLYGRLFGADFNFLPQKLPCADFESIFTVALEFDFRDVYRFLPLELQKRLKSLKLEEKMSINGNLLLDLKNVENSYFKGIITTKNIEIQDFIIQNIQAQITYDQLKLKIDEFSLADAAILAKFDQMVVDFNREKFMNFEMKNFQVHDFRPSLITKVNHPKSRIKPFLVRNLKIDECKGNLIRQNEIKGRGHLQFINTFKREYHFMDIPIEIISRLGLDIGLLVPVRGEVDIEIKDRKIWLKDLKNSFSDGRRSHFYFPSGKPCFVDFDGNINIDVKMKQYVLFKLTQPFTLSLRGTLEKPSFSLK